MKPRLAFTALTLVLLALFAAAEGCADDAAFTAPASDGSAPASDGSPSGELDGSKAALLDATTDAPAEGDGAVDGGDAGPCVYEDHACFGGCSCPPAEGYRLDPVRNCIEQEPAVVMCWSGEQTCNVFPATTCLSRTLADGGIEAFFLPSFPASSSSSTDLEPCPSEVEQRVAVAGEAARCPAE